MQALSFSSCLFFLLLLMKEKHLLEIFPKEGLLCRKLLWAKLLWVSVQQGTTRKPICKVSKPPMPKRHCALLEHVDGLFYVINCLLLMLKAAIRLPFEATAPSIWGSWARHKREVCLRTDILALAQLYEVLVYELDTAIRVFRICRIAILQRETVGVIDKDLELGQLLFQGRLMLGVGVLTLQSGTSWPNKLQKASPTATWLCSITLNQSARESPLGVTPSSVDPTQSYSPAK